MMLQMQIETTHVIVFICRAWHPFPFSRGARLVQLTLLRSLFLGVFTLSIRARARALVALIKLTSGANAAPPLPIPEASKDLPSKPGKEKDEGGQ